MINRYALVDYILSITFTGNQISGISGNTFSIGGPAASTGGGYIGEITLSRSAEMWKTTGDYTGGYVHTKNLDRTGTVKVTINQLSDDIVRLNTIFNLYEQSNTSNDRQLTLSVMNAATGDTVATCTDCRIVKLPDQVFGTDVASQDWEFTCGIINIEYPVKVAAGE